MDLAADADVVVEFAGGDFADRKRVSVHAESACVVAEDEPEDESSHECAEPVGEGLLAEYQGYAFLFF